MLGNSNQNPPGSKTMSKIWHAAYYAQEERNACVTVVEVDGDKITITAELDDGRIADKCVIDKGKDEILPHAVAPFFGPNRTKMFFKGMDLGLMQADLCCRNIDGIWYGALGLLAPFVGGDVKKTEGKIRLDMYAHWAEFTENSDIAETDRGQVKLPATVKRLNRDQLYIPFDAVHILKCVGLMQSEITLFPLSMKAKQSM